MYAIRLIVFLCALAVMASTAGAAVIFQESFETYNADATLHGQGGWTYDPAYGTDPLDIRSSSPDEAWVLDTSSAGRLTYTSADSSIILDGGNRALRIMKHFDDPADGNDHVTKFTHVAACNDLSDIPGTIPENDTAIYFSMLMMRGASVGSSDDAHLSLLNKSASGGNDTLTELGQTKFNDGAWHTGMGGTVNTSTSAATAWVADGHDADVHLLVGKLEKVWQWHVMGSSQGR